MDLDLFGAFESGETIDEVAPAENVPSKKRAAAENEAAPATAKLKPSTDSSAEGDNGGDTGAPGVTGAAAAVEPVPRAASGVTHTQVRKMEWSGRSVTTFSALPEGYVSTEEEGVCQTMPEDPAKVYPFELDPFQKQSIAYIERNESVLVSAHTSAGKTVVAEYAVARSLKNKQRVIYTSPIKALSNQKFRDMQEEFGVDEVGLMTGDVTINPGATCLIMTTEILRSMLYRGSEVMREVAWVIYDEIHYMRDKERGVVWEESIILLPHKVRFVFLSATIPNAREFVGWIAAMHHQACHVVYTEYRPTPLQHYIFPAGGDGLHLVVDDKGVFREDNFQHAMAKLQQNTPEENIVLGHKGGGKGGKGGKGRGGNGDSGQSDLAKIINLVMERRFDPVIVFSFAKRECEANALQMSKQDFNDEEEKDLVGEVFANAIAALSDDDKTLPQVENLLPILKRGIGIHHGGLLPILKEVIEILFQEGLLKCLFATETFSIGLNMPAHTVVFTACRKFDGKDFRWISAGEYIQMAGRAGRRGKDDKGIVIQMLDEKMEPSVCKGILYGQPDELYSSYHVSYNMLLNMLRVEGADPHFLVQSSFHQYQQEAGAPALEARAAELVEQRDALEVGTPEEETQLKAHFLIGEQLSKCQADLRALKMQPENVLPFLAAGRLVWVVVQGTRPAKDTSSSSAGASASVNESAVKAGGVGGGGGGSGSASMSMSQKRSGIHKAGAEDDETFEDDFGWGAVVDFKAPKKGGLSVADAADIFVEVALSCRKEASDSSSSGDNSRGSGSSSSSGKSVPKGEPRPVVDPTQAEVRVVRVALTALKDVSAVRIHLPRDLTSPESRAGVSKTIGEVSRRLAKVNMHPLDPVSDMKIAGSDLDALLERKSLLEKRRVESPVTQWADHDEKLARYAEKHTLSESAKALRKAAKQATAPAMKDAMKRMQRVLKRLGHVHPSTGVIETKGRVACEVNTADELLVTELVFTGAFIELPDAETAALLSCLVHGERRKEEGPPTLPNNLQAPYRALLDTAKVVVGAMVDCKVEDADAEEYLNGLNPDLMEVVYGWCNGAKFVDVVKLTSTYEGTVIRVIRRLEELLRQLASASFVIGNAALKEKFERCAASLRRDIVFAASLYL